MRLGVLVRDAELGNGVVSMYMIINIPFCLGSGGAPFGNTPGWTVLARAHLPVWRIWREQIVKLGPRRHFETAFLCMYDMGLEVE